MAKLNEFELKVVNKEIRQLDFKDVVEIFSDCKFLSVSSDLSKLANIVNAITLIPDELQRELAWESAKYTFKDVFAKATITIAPRFHICEMPIPVESDKNCSEEKGGEHCVVEQETQEPTPAKRKTTKK